MITKQERYILRKQRTSKKIFKRGITRPRLCVTRTNRYLYAQVVNDIEGRTLAFASTLEKDLRDRISKLNKSAKSVEACRILGEVIAKRALEKGIKKVVFDRGGRIFHGRIKAVADSARENGLEF
ncbi:MAG: 50S ribosomal protein L18 [Elusimicrobiales bacterium]